MSIKPELLGGFRDMLPTEAIIQQRMIDKVRRVYESFGFVPLETPCMEDRAVLTGNEPDFNKSIFEARITKGKEDSNVTDADWEQNYALRFDLTVPLARVVSAYPNLPKPFKRYQIGKVWRGERPQAGRYREFFQFDFDTIGSNSIMADVEVIQVMVATMRELGVEDFQVRFNTRKVLNGLAEVVGCGDNAKELFRIIDKMDKIGMDGVKAELQRQPDNSFDENALALSDQQTAMVMDFLTIGRSDPENMLDKLSAILGDGSVSGKEGVEELQQIVAALTALGIPRRFWQLDLNVARGLDYYTGPVFETYLTKLPDLGSVFSGGRFDGLTNRFSPGSNIAGVGASVGIDRLIVGMQQLGLVTNEESLTDILVTIFSPEMASDSLKLAEELRSRGKCVELYLGDDRTLRAQVAYAAKKGIPFVVIAGPEEVSAGVVKLKTMATRAQDTLTKDELYSRLS